MQMNNFVYFRDGETTPYVPLRSIPIGELTAASQFPLAGVRIEAGQFVTFDVVVGFALAPAKKDGVALIELTPHSLPPIRALPVTSQNSDIAGIAAHAADPGEPVQVVSTAEPWPEGLRATRVWVLAGSEGDV